ncbi:MAG: AEC family transporter [Bacteroidia bacterium]|nr:AEC family transporter [Bacteroidia bacterium]
MENIIFILVLLAIGFALKHLRAFPEAAAQVLTSFVIYVSLPAVILVQIPKIELSTDLLIPFLMPWAMILVSATLVWSLARIFRWSKSITGALMLLVPLGNTSFFGFPMVNAFFGEAGIPYALLYDQLGTFLALATYGTVVVAVYAGQEQAKVKDILRKIATFPPLLALLLAFALRGWVVPQAVTFMLEGLAATLIPLVIIAVGMKMEFRLEREHFSPLAVGLGLKLVLAPLLALLIIRFLGAEGLAAQVSVFEAGMPSQVSAWALTMSVGLAPRLGAMMVGLGILLSFATLSGVWWLLG